MRQKCKDCGDKLFKIIDGKIQCRKGHVYGVYAIHAVKNQGGMEE